MFAIVSFVVVAPAPVNDHEDEHHAHPHNERGCAHGTLGPEVYKSAPQEYTTLERGRSLSHEITATNLPKSSWQDLRIYPNQVGMFSSTQHTLLFDTATGLIPAALSWISGALKVNPMTSPLLIPRDACQANWPGGVCAIPATNTYCGSSTDTARVSVPDAYLHGLRHCSTCYNNPGQSDCGGSASTCTNVAAGAGIAGTDYVLHVTAVESTGCLGGALAYATTCARDQNDRPIMGHANFCPSRLASSDYDTQA